MDYNKEEIDKKLAEIHSDSAKRMSFNSLSEVLIVKHEWDEDYRKAAKTELLSRINKQS